MYVYRGKDSLPTGHFPSRTFFPDTFTSGQFPLQIPIGHIPSGQFPLIMTIYSYQRYDDLTATRANGCIAAIGTK